MKAGYGALEVRSHPLISFLSTRRLKELYKKWRPDTHVRSSQLGGRRERLRELQDGGQKLIFPLVNMETSDIGVIGMDPVYVAHCPA
jgi:hypothetical protein